MTKRDLIPLLRARLTRFGERDVSRVPDELVLTWYCSCGLCGQEMLSLREKDVLVEASGSVERFIDELNLSWLTHRKDDRHCAGMAGTHPIYGAALSAAPEVRLG
jgi:hypothetical protein